MTMVYWGHRLFAEGGAVCFWQAIDDVEHGAFWMLDESGWCAYAEPGGERLCNTGGNALPDDDTMEFVAEAIVASGEYDKKMAAEYQAERDMLLATGDYTTCPGCGEPMLLGEILHYPACSDCLDECLFGGGEDE